MKNSKVSLVLALIAGICFFSNPVQAQTPETEKPKGNFINNFSVTPSIGMLHSFGDFRDGKLMPDYLKFSENKFGYGMSLNYDFFGFLRISAGISGGKLSGKQESINTLNAVNATSDLGNGVLFKTNILELTFPSVDINLTKLIFKDKSKFFNSFSVHAFLSHGLIFFDSKIYAMQDESVHLLYGKHRGQSGKTTEAVTSYGMNLCYKLNDRFDVSLGASLKNVWNDRLDAWESPGSANDKFSYTSLGVTFYFKKGKKKNKKTTQKDKTKPAVVEKEEKTEVLNDSLKPTLIVPKVEEVIEKEEEEEKVTEKVEEVVDKADTLSTRKDSIPEQPEVILVQEDTQKVESKKPVGDIYNGRGNFIIVAAFQTLKRAKISAAEQNAKGEFATIVKNRSNTMYLVSIGRFDDRQEALNKMREVRKNGTYKDAWVLYKDLKQ